MRCTEDTFSSDEGEITGNMMYTLEGTDYNRFCCTLAKIAKTTRRPIFMQSLIGYLCQKKLVE